MKDDKKELSDEHGLEEPTKTSQSTSDSSALIVESEELFRGRREVWIRHGNEMYRLRETSAGKLYLSK